MGACTAWDSRKRAGLRPVREEKCKKEQNEVAGSESCSNLPTRSEKRGLRKRGTGSEKRPVKLGIRNDLLEKTEAT
jgi:hypothetical protein